MAHLRLRLTVVVCAVAAATVLVGVGTASSTMWRVQASRPSHLVTCTGRSVTRPSSFVLACADGTASLARLHWKTWGPSRATARGVFNRDDCRPDCVRGRFAHYAARVVADDVARSTGAARIFTRIVVGWVAGGRHHSMTWGIRAATP